MIKKIMLVALLALIPNTAFAWPSISISGANSVHYKLTDRAFKNLEGKLSKEFLNTWRDQITWYTNTVANDTAAHGGVLKRNGGDIDFYFTSFKVAYSEGRWEDAARYLGYCIHLIEDMNVPAHAYNIPHYTRYSTPTYLPTLTTSS